VYDVTNRKSFDNITRWLGEVRDIVGEHCLVMMIGNKIDLTAQGCPVVSTAEGKELAMKHKIAFIETSAKENKGVTAAFQHLLQAIYNLDMHNNQQQSTTTTTRQDQGFILRNPSKSRNGSNGSHYGDSTSATASDTAMNQKPLMMTRCCNIGG
jgi:GTPase SAR1 family protein